MTTPKITNPKITKFEPQRPADEKARVIETEEGLIVIRTNGPDQPEDLEALCDLLKKEPLALATFAKYGFITFLEDERVLLWGGFLRVSHVFEIEGPKRHLQKVINEIDVNIKRQCEVINKIYAGG